MLDVKEALAVHIHRFIYTQYKLPIKYCAKYEMPIKKKNLCRAKRKVMNVYKRN